MERSFSAFPWHGLPDGGSFLFLSSFVYPPNPTQSNPMPGNDIPSNKENRTNMLLKCTNTGRGETLNRKKNKNNCNLSNQTLKFSPPIPKSSPSSPRIPIAPAVRLPAVLHRKRLLPGGASVSPLFMPALTPVSAAIC